ncbi:TIM barrel protein [Propionibacterium australiense]|nr:TIM barrel protein [Propionibacterium australiense]SYZ34544.1 Hydroxypyruvate isomerase-like [Propionibacterium australiense]VEH89680.1 Hydroxypyruvate isomerase [Propionibacterium australiense]
MELAPNIELLFTEAGESYADRIRAAHQAGFTAVEMWGPTGKDFPARPKDIDALKAALDETGVRIVAQLAEPRTNYTTPPKDLGAFFVGLDAGVEIAHRLGVPRIVLGCGAGFAGSSRQHQLDELIDVFSRAVERTEGSGVTLVVEPVNTRVDHPGSLLDFTEDAVHVARQVDSDRFGILYDLYHSTAQGEDPAREISAAAETIKYVQIADFPGRGEPGSGAIDWATRLSEMVAVGYQGPIGLEYFPTIESVASTRFISELSERF